MMYKRITRFIIEGVHGIMTKWLLGWFCSKLALKWPRVSVKFEFRYESLKSKFSFNSFCQQVDDGMLLKIKEKIIRENTFEQKKKKPGLNLTLG